MYVLNHRAGKLHFSGSLGKDGLKYQAFFFFLKDVVHLSPKHEVLAVWIS